MKKALFTFISILFVFIVIQSCNNGISNKIIGKWNLVNQISIVPNIMIISKYDIEFTEKGNCIATVGVNALGNYSEQTKAETYKIDGNQIIISKDILTLTNDGFLIGKTTVSMNTVEIKFKKGD